VNSQSFVHSKRSKSNFWLTVIWKHLCVSFWTVCAFVIWTHCIWEARVLLWIVLTFHSLHRRSQKWKAKCFLHFESLAYAVMAKLFRIFVLTDFALYCLGWTFFLQKPFRLLFLVVLMLCKWEGKMVYVSIFAAWKHWVSITNSCIGLDWNALSLNCFIKEKCSTFEICCLHCLRGVNGLFWMCCFLLMWCSLVLSFEFNCIASNHYICFLFPFFVLLFTQQFKEDRKNMYNNWSILPAVHTLLELKD
jgi:hypothetical protein